MSDPINDRGSSSVDRSFDLEHGHLLPPLPDPNRLVVFEGGDPRAVDWAAERLRSGGVIALPTDTVYGIAAALNHPAALERLFIIKGRPADKPLPVLLASDAALGLVAEAVNPDLLVLAKRFWPGPLTVVVPAHAGMPERVRATDGTVGVRVPNHPLTLQLLERAGGALAVTSANRSGQPPSFDAAGVTAALGPDIDLLLDGGPTPGEVPSTVIRLFNQNIQVLRAGLLTEVELHNAWADIQTGQR